MSYGVGMTLTELRQALTSAFEHIGNARHEVSRAQGEMGLAADRYNGLLAIEAEYQRRLDKCLASENSTEEKVDTPS